MIATFLYLSLAKLVAKILIKKAINKEKLNNQYKKFFDTYFSLSNKFINIKTINRINTIIVLRIAALASIKDIAKTPATKDDKMI